MDIEEDPLYLQAIRELESEHDVVFPRALTKHLCRHGFDEMLISRGCEEHIYCATGINVSWHYFRTVADDMLATYKTMPLPTMDHSHPEQGKWKWRFMDENQGCADWSAYYDTADDENPMIYGYIDGNENGAPLEVAPWDRFILRQRTVEAPAQMQEMEEAERQN